MIPGQKLHRLAARICSANTIEQVVEPAIADLQREYADGADRSPTRRLWALVSGYIALWKVIALSAGPLELPDGDRLLLARAVFWAVEATVGLSALLMVPPVVGLSQLIKPRHIVLLIPQALPLTIPTGIVLGIAVGVGGRTISRGAVRTLLLVAILGSAVSFGTMNGLMPAANQSFRQDVFNAMGNDGTVMRGSNEMTLAELRREANTASILGQSEKARHLMWKYHLRWALPSAAFALSMFALAAAGRQQVRAKAVVLMTPLVYFVLLFAGEALAIRTSVPPYAGAWLASLAFGLAAMAMFLRRTATEVSRAG